MSQNEHQTPATTRKRSFAVVALPLVFIALLLLNLLPPMFLTSLEPETPNRPTILITPFTVSEASPELENLALNIEAGISTRLKETAGLQVISHPASSRVVGPRSTREPLEGAAEADFRVEGAIRGELDNLEVSVRLTRLAPHSQLWTREFNRTTDDVAQLRDDIATRIVSTVRAAGSENN